MEIWLSYGLLGIFVGLVAGLFGIGGGVLMVPALFLTLQKQGLPPEQSIFVATKTSLAIILFTSLSSAFSHHKKEPIDQKILFQIIVFIIIGTVFGTFFVEHINGKTLEILFAIYITLISIKMWIGFKVPAQSAPRTPSTALNIFVGIIIGFKSAILGIGGGTISIPYLSWQSVPMAQAVGLSASFGFVIALFGTITHILRGANINGLDGPLLGYIYIPALLGVLSMSLIFSRVGVHFAHKLPKDKLRKAFSLLLITLAIKTIYSLLVS